MGEHKSLTFAKGVSGRPDVYGTAVTEVQITPWPRLSSLFFVRAPLRVGGGGGDRPDTAMESASRTRFETTCTSAPAPRGAAARAGKREWFGSKFAEKLRHLDPVKLAYLRTSFVFAISILVTWTPSSINRVHNLIHPNTVSFGLNVASAVVLPLQGVWNAVIYFSTSWGVCKEEVRKTWVWRLVRRWGEAVEERGGRGREEGEEREEGAMEMGRVGNVRAMRGSF